VRLGTDDFVRDYVEAFEGFCGARRGRLAHVLLWRCAASLCRIFEAHCWAHLLSFDEPSRVEIHPVASLDQIALVTAMPPDREGGGRVINAFGCTSPDADAARALGAIEELHAAAAHCVSARSSAVGANLVFARSALAGRTLAAFSNFCTLIRDKSNAVFGLYNIAGVGCHDRCAWTADLTEDGRAFLAAVRAASQSWPCWRAHWPETRLAFAESAMLAMRTW